MNPNDRYDGLVLLILRMVLFAILILGLLMLWFFVLLPLFFQ
jgi:hypothetical protein